MFKALLYFNLPYESIIQHVVAPKKIFDYRIEEAADKKSEKTLGDLIEQFEKYTEGKSSVKTTPSIILMKIEMGTDEEGTERSYIIGGYASHGWLVSGGYKQGSGNGDSSCFLFNLTLNLRFNAREGLPYY